MTQPFEKKGKCHNCHGTKKIPGSDIDCPQCSGTGVVSGTIKNEEEKEIRVILTEKEINEFVAKYGPDKIKQDKENREREQKDPSFPTGYNHTDKQTIRRETATQVACALFKNPKLIENQMYMEKIMAENTLNAVADYSIQFTDLLLKKLGE